MIETILKNFFIDMKILIIFFDIHTIEIRSEKSVLQFSIENFLLLHAHR